jgi:DNA polymerase-3 subunit gamma/tau
MELGEEVKKSFETETEPLSTDYLLDAIALINSFEVNYKSVNNKRVHVELSLMQLASLHFDGEKKKAT